MLESARKFFAAALSRGNKAAATAPATPTLNPGGSGLPDWQSIFSEGVQHYQAGRYEHAVASFQKVVELAHDHVEAHLNLGLSYKNLSRADDAEDCFLLAQTLRPGYPEAYFNLGVLSLERGQVDEAVAEFEKAISLRPHYVEALSNLGYAQFHYKNDFSAGKRNLLQAISIEPDFLDAHCNLAMLFQRVGHIQAALEKYSDILARNPSCDEARLNRSLILLARGHFEEGWQEYEVRKRVKSYFGLRKFPYTDWDGSIVPGGTILIYGEQGLGDEIMFASCVPEVMSGGMLCVIDCSPKLQALFQRSFPGAIVHGSEPTTADLRWLSACPVIDCQTAIGSLPYYLRRHEKDFPKHSGYLFADAARTGYWRSQLNALGPGLKVGLSWRGGTRHTNQAMRSISLVELLPLFTTRNAHFVSLQYTDCREEIAAFCAEYGVVLHHWQEAIDNYDETAALVTALDLTVTVQTAVAHLGGALGTPVWVMVPAVAEWRYQCTGESLPWYPSLRVFRQAERGNWQEVVNTLSAKLVKLAGERDLRQGIANHSIE